MLSLTAILFLGTQFANGVTGPFMIMLIPLPVIAGLLAGPRAARHMALSVGLIFLALMALERLDVLQPRGMAASTTRLVSGLLFLATLAMTSFTVRRFVDLSQRSLHTAQLRGQELAEVSQQAQQSVQAEREAREREQRAARQLRQTIQEYIGFLEQVAAGDYQAQLDLDEPEGAEGQAAELRTLGEYLASTVDTLVRALQNMQLIQHRYLSQAWDSFVATRAAHRGFRYQDALVEPSDQAWLDPMTKAVQDKDLVITDEELALPIQLRGEVIGAIGARRDGGGSWSDDDIALAAAVTDQLAQTIESLRLLDETQNRAARERLTTEVTSRIRETLDIDTILQTTVREMGEALGITEVEVRMTNRIETQSSPTGANGNSRDRGKGDVPPVEGQA
jgi:GAF domain-containing protein